MKASATLLNSWKPGRLDPPRLRPHTPLAILDRDAGFKQSLVSNTSRLLGFFQKKLIRLNTLVSRSELRSVLAASGDALPDDANYKVGNIIHALAGRSLHQKLRVYGATTGGFSVVYTVLDDDTLEPYCLKAPRGPLTDDSDLDRIAREAKTWIRLGKHPHIVFAHSLLEINGCTNILLEYIPGQSLSSRLKQSLLSVEEVLRYAIQLCRGMEYAQSKLPGFVHGDLKPGNCLLTVDGVLKLTDFGEVRSAAKAEGDHFRDQVPEKGVADESPSTWAAGTPAYMAPEQFDAAYKTDVRSDVYSFGVTLFEILTGQKPFSGDEHHECFLQHQNVTPPDLRYITPDVPERLAELVEKCLSKCPSDRPEDFSVIDAELSAIFRDTFQQIIPEAVPEPPTFKELIHRGASLAVLELYDEALESLDQALLMDPRSAVAWILKGKALSSTGSCDEALACFRRALHLDSNQPSAWNEASEVFAQTGDYEAALRCSDRAIALEKSAPSLWISRGVSFVMAKQFGPGLKCFKQAIELDSQSASAHLRLGTLHYEQGLSLHGGPPLGDTAQLEEAVACFKQAIRLNPLCYETQCKLAGAYSSLGLTEETIEVCREALASRPASTELRNTLRLAYRELYAKRTQDSKGEGVESLVDFLVETHAADFVVGRSLSLLSTSEYDPLVFYLCASELLHAARALRSSQKRDLLDALAQVGGRLSTDSADRKSYYWLGRLYYRLGRYDECMETYRQRSARYGPDDKALYYLAACHEINKNYEQALVDYKQAFILDSKCRLTRKAIRRVEASIAGDKTINADLPELAY